MARTYIKIRRETFEGLSQQQFPGDMANTSRVGTVDSLRHYRDVQLPNVTGKVTPFKDLTHPSKLNKRYFLCW